MSTLTAAPRRDASSPDRPSTGAVTTPAGTSGLEARRRGRLVLAEKVVEKIAAQAAAEIGTTRGKSGGLLGIGADPDPAARPRVEVDLTAESADVEVAVGIAYPGSIRQTAQDIREHVTARVLELTGVPVHRVDVDVTFLTPPSDPARTRRMLR